MICVAVTYVILPNREDEAIDLFTQMTEASLQEPGCRMYQVHRSRQEPRRFFLYEQYDDEKALEAHRASPHFEQLVLRGLFRILESRTPDTWIPLQLPEPARVSAVSLSLDVPEPEAERVEALLWDAGATGLEIRDREAPPMPGVRGPSPGEAIVVAWFEGRGPAEAALEDVRAWVPAVRGVLEEAPETDWSTAWRARIRSTRVGRLWVGPPWETAPEGTVALTIEPKMAFGTGDHPTTALCLAAVEAFCTAHPGASVLDVGTGTGVLALMARKLGAGRVVGVDNDPMSVTLARENAALNGIAGVELSGATLDSVDGRFDLVLANILANTLVELAAALVRRAREHLVLAGVLIHQEDEVRAAFERTGAVSAGGARSGDWVRLDFRMS